ncbi:MAG: sarcosine oxidase subunit gamma [Steroidobacteraceae bacterium]
MGADQMHIETSAFAGLPTAAGRGHGIIATERDALGIVRITARRAQMPNLAEILRANFGVDPPNALRRVSLGDVGIAAIAPHTWLATRENAGNAFAQSLQSLLGHCASVADQSDAYVILGLVGSRVREMLAKLVPIDIHPRQFQVNDLAQTICGYIGVILWRLEDSAEGDPVFELWAARSLAVSLHQAISNAAAEFGFVRERGRRTA